MRESELHLRQTMLEALKDVEDTRSDLVSTTDSTVASDQSLTLSTQLYKGGAASFLDVLDAQASYLRAADLLNQAKREHALAAVALYRSLGGGWSVTDDASYKTASESK